MFKSDVFERVVGQNEMARNTFYLTIGVVLTWGFIATCVVSNLTASWKPSTLEILIVGLGIPLIGIFMSGNKFPIFSFVGFNLVVIPFGAILGPTFTIYNIAKPGIVSEAAMLTAIVAGIMAVTGLMFPNFYRSIGGALIVGLCSLLVVLLLSFLIPSLMNLTIIHYLAAGLFALYIGFDMWRASEIPATLDNAVDVSIALYLDIINLLLWILRILSGSGGSKD